MLKVEVVGSLQILKLRPIAVKCCGEKIGHVWSNYTNNKNAISGQVQTIAHSRLSLALSL